VQQWKAAVQAIGNDASVSKSARREKLPQDDEVRRFLAYAKRRVENAAKKGQPRPKNIDIAKEFDSKARLPEYLADQLKPSRFGHLVDR
jgi:hypothetical protein